MALVIIFDPSADLVAVMTFGGLGGNGTANPAFVLTAQYSNTADTWFMAGGCGAL